MIRIMEGKRTDKEMARAMFKYICPENERMDRKSFTNFIELFGLNTYGISSADIFRIVSNNREHITDSDFYNFTAGKLSYYK
mmetsp:Transcript_6388/g.5490  ORF Transcript_6388/g.5490 Transcript_6388/m.5490 type:complete len:82 (-) Transcript_6388:296-541(-)